MHGVRSFGVSSVQRGSRAGQQIHRSLRASGSTIGVRHGDVRSYSAALPKRSPVTFTKPSVASSTFSSVPTCPEPTCECAATPKLPKPIDYAANIRESAPGYIQHVVICTGRSDWRSRIEDEGKQDGETVAPEAPTAKERFKGLVKSFGRMSWRRSGDGLREIGLGRGLKAGLGRHGAYFDPMRPMLVTNASFSPPRNGYGASGEPEVAAFLFPAFQYVSGIPDRPSGHEAFLRTFLATDDALAAADSQVWQTTPVCVPTILICSHATRDARCGVLGPLLHAEFQRQLARVGISSREHGVSEHANEHAHLNSRVENAVGQTWSSANVGMVSHIGGHKWAGNVIVYMPPSSTPPSSTGQVASHLAGKGVWYGRVEPRHVEGIVRETILQGRVIEELCRGVRG